MGTLKLAAPIPLPVRRNGFFCLTAAKIQGSQVPGRRVRFQFPLANLALVASSRSSFRMAIADLCSGITHLPFRTWLISLILNRHICRKGQNLVRFRAHGLRSRNH
jgi:hypothetical protein